MWYLAEIVFAEPSRANRESYQCESCNVVFQADSADAAYRKAISWGQAYVAEAPAGMQMLGVSHLTSIGEELADGVEICGNFFEELNVWDRIDELIPPAHRLKAIQWEQGRDSPLKNLFDIDGTNH